MDGEEQSCRTGAEERRCPYLRSSRLSPGDAEPLYGDHEANASPAVYQAMVQGAHQLWDRAALSVVTEFSDTFFYGQE